MKCNYSVTFEFPLRPPETYRGTVEAGMAWTCARMAIYEAQRALKPVGWSSLVFVILDRTAPSGLAVAEVDDPITEIDDGE